jgi:hypothetical protein
MVTVLVVLYVDTADSTMAAALCEPKVTCNFTNPFVDMTLKSSPDPVVMH